MDEKNEVKATPPATGRETNMQRLMGFMPISHLAKKIGYTPNAVAAWIYGNAKMPVQACLLISQNLNVPVDVLANAHDLDYKIAQGFDPNEIPLPMVQRNLDPSLTAGANNNSNADLIYHLEQALQIARSART